MSATKVSLRDLLRAVPNGGATDSGPASEAALGTPSRTPAPPAGEDGDLAGRLLRALMDRTAPTYVTDAGGNLIAYSKSFSELCVALYGIQPRDGAERGLTPPGIMEMVEQLYGDKREIRRSDTVQLGGETRHFVSRHFPIHDNAGNHIGFGGVYEDVSSAARAARKSLEIEGWLHDVIRSSSDWIWAIDANFNITFVSPRISEILDEPAQLLVGRHLFSLGEFDAEDRLSAKTRADMGRHSPFRTRHFVITGKGGKRCDILLSGVPVFEENSGRFVGYRGTGTDVTGRYEAERTAVRVNRRLQATFEELQRRNEELAIALEHSKVADHAKMDFLAMMSHELKTPLNCIIGFSDAALQGVHGRIDNTYREYFHNIHKAGQHLHAIINDLLDAANLERRDVTVRVEPVAVERLIAEAVSLVDLSSAADHLDLSALTPTTDYVVQADHLRARQIIVNLISNALKFTPDQGRIGISVSESPNGMVAITVWDTGIGIPADEQKRVFDKFYQVEHNILSRGTEGTGLGLNISRRLARLMGGDLTLVSVPGQGSRFTLELPRADSL